MCRNSNYYNLLTDCYNIATDCYICVTKCAQKLRGFFTEIHYRRCCDLDNSLVQFLVFYTKRFGILRQNWSRSNKDIRTRLRKEARCWWLPTDWHFDWKLGPGMYLPITRSRRLSTSLTNILGCPNQSCTLPSAPRYKKDNRILYSTIRSSSP